MAAISAKPEPNKYVAIASRNSRESVAVYATLSENISSNICGPLKRSQNRHVDFWNRSVSPWHRNGADNPVLLRTPPFGVSAVKMHRSNELSGAHLCCFDRQLNLPSGSSAAFAGTAGRAPKPAGKSSAKLKRIRRGTLCRAALARSGLLSLQ
jgi:hypothetical protein